GREAVPLPERRVDLHQLEAAVTRVALELHLRQSVERERAQEPQGCVDDLLDPERLPHAARAHDRRRLAQLAPTEHAQSTPVAGHVAADAVEVVVAARYELLHHRLERLRASVRVLDLGRRLTAERLAAKPPLE